MPKPKRKRISKATARDAALDAAQQTQEGVLGSTQLPRSTSPEEREAFEMPDLGALAAKLRRDLDREPDPARRLRLYDLALQELEVARDKGSRLYAMQINAGELVNPEDVEAYAVRLVELIAKLHIERERLSLDQESGQSAIVASDIGPLMKSSIPSTSTFAPTSSVKVYPDILTAAETAELLRLKLARFYQVYQSLGVPYFTEHSQLRFRKAQVEAWVEQQEKSVRGSSPKAREVRRPSPKLGTGKVRASADSRNEVGPAAALASEPPLRDSDAPDSRALSEALVQILLEAKHIDQTGAQHLSSWIRGGCRHLPEKDRTSWLTGRKTLCTFMVAAQQASLLSLEIGTKKSGKTGPFYEKAVLGGFLDQGEIIKGGIDRNLAEAEAALTAFREIMAEYQQSLSGHGKAHDELLAQLQIYLEVRRSSDFTPYAARLAEMGFNGKKTVSILSALSLDTLLLFGKLAGA